jgi:AcrR family transcriptional regulator
MTADDATNNHENHSAPGYLALIRAGETLFAERGLNGVSLREIMRSAGQRNARALQYHFGDRLGLCEAILAKHRRDIEIRRHTLLDQYEISGPPTMRDLAHALVAPLAAKLNSRDGGREYLQIAAELMNITVADVGTVRPALIEDLSFSDASDSTSRWVLLARPLMPEGTAGPPLHRPFTVIRFAHLEIGRRARRPPHDDHRLYTSQIIDMVVALLALPLSPETARLVQELETKTARR